MKQTTLYNKQFSTLKSLHLNLSSPLLDNCDYHVWVGESVTCTKACRSQMDEKPQLLWEEDAETFLRNLNAIDIGDWELNYRGDAEDSDEFRWSLILEYQDETALTYVGVKDYPDRFLALLKLLQLEDWLLTLAPLP